MDAHLCVCIFVHGHMPIYETGDSVYLWLVCVGHRFGHIQKKVEMEKKNSNNDKKQSLGYGKVERGMGRKGMSPTMEGKVDS